MVNHRKHRNVLYSLVILLAVIILVSFTVLSIQISNMNSRFESGLDSTKKELKEYSEKLVKSYDAGYQENFIEISEILIGQQRDFEQEINLLKSSQEDFSGIVQSAVRSVVTISADNSLGTGFIVEENGYIVTNYHILEKDNADIRILTYNRESLKAELVGKDELRDLALLKISGNYPILELSDSADVQVGKKVIAIGNPLGLSFTVTEGIISGLNRRGPNGLNEYVQTDVSLNPGNSGGPLIDTRGKVVGINNFKIGGADSLGFALESDSVKTFVDSLLKEQII